MSSIVVLSSREQLNRLPLGSRIPRSKVPKAFDDHHVSASQDRLLALGTGVQLRKEISAR
jgi:hypothetical protein